MEWLSVTHYQVNQPPPQNVTASKKKKTHVIWRRRWWHFCDSANQSGLSGVVLLWLLLVVLLRSFLEAGKTGFSLSMWVLQWQVSPFLLHAQSPRKLTWELPRFLKVWAGIDTASPDHTLLVKANHRTSPEARGEGYTGYKSRKHVARGSANAIHHHG